MQLRGNIRKFPLQDSGNHQPAAGTEQFTQLFRVGQEHIGGEVGANQIVPPRWA